MTPVQQAPHTTGCQAGEKVLTRLFSGAEHFPRRLPPRRGAALFLGDSNYWSEAAVLVVPVVQAPRMELEHADRLEAEGRALLAQSLAARLLDAQDTDDRFRVFALLEEEFARLLTVLRSR